MDFIFKFKNSEAIIIGRKTQFWNKHCNIQTMASNQFLRRSNKQKKIIRRLRPEHLTDNVLRKDKLGSKAIGENT